MNLWQLLMLLSKDLIDQLICLGQWAARVTPSAIAMVKEIGASSVPMQMTLLKPGRWLWRQSNSFMSTQMRLITFFAQVKEYWGTGIKEMSKNNPFISQGTNHTRFLKLLKDGLSKFQILSFLIHERRWPEIYILWGIAKRLPNLRVRRLSGESQNQWT